MATNYDIHIQLVDPAKQESHKFYTFGFQRTLGIRGIQKLVNIFAKHLLTPVGSDPTDLTYGTTFPSLIGSNINLEDAKDVLALSVEATSTFIKNSQRSREVPLDERLASVTITNFIADETLPGFAAQILITNVAGQGLKILLPTLEIL